MITGFLLLFKPRLVRGMEINMKISEIWKLVWLNLSQNKSKVILTSTGILVGAATIMLVLAIGTGGKLEVAEQFKNLNAGAIDITYEYNGNEMSGGGMPGGRMGQSSGGGMPGGMGAGAGQGGSGMGGFPGMFGFSEQTNTENIILSQEDLNTLKEEVSGISDGTLSYTSNADVDGGDLEETATYTIAGVQSNYTQISNLEMALGEFLTEEDNTYKEKTCVLGWQTAKDIFGSAMEAYDETVYIDNRAYTVSGVLEEIGTVASGISPDDAIFIPYETGIKYLTGKNVSPTLTVIAEDVDQVNAVMEQIETVLAESYPEAVFTMSDAGSKMEAANQSNETLTLLLISMAVIVFFVGGIGIMNVLFVSVKERTNEIGILKAIGCSQKDILVEFLLEASCISLVGAILGVICAAGITPLIEYFSVRVELSVSGAVLSLAFGILTGTVFGFYPALKASRLVPVVALNHE